MSKITAIEPQQKNPNRVNVYLDGAFAFGLARIVAAWLKVGQELDEEKIAALQADDEREAVYQKALHFLSFRPRSSDEVRRNLSKRGVPEALIAATLQRLQEAGALDDAAFAQAWIENRSTFRPRSKSALRFELRRKGLDENAVAAALDGAVDEEALARAAARKYAARLAGLEWPEFRQKLGGFLARRGFPYAISAPIVSEVWKEISPTADDGETFDNEV